MAEKTKVSATPGFHHTSKLYDILEYNWVVFPLTHLATYFLLRELVKVTGYYALVTQDDAWETSTTIHFVMNIFFLIAQFPPYASVWGMCLPLRPRENKENPKSRTFKTLRVCLVTKGTNFDTVIKSTKHWDNLQHPQIQFHALVDSGNGSKFEGHLPSYINIDDVPDSFEVKNAKYKARALEFFRRKHNLTKEDWVLHLDEESEIDDYVIETCLDFIERGNAQVGMGTIYYNGASHWDNALLSTAEALRIAEDFGRFQLPVRLFNRPQLGWMHGSWILINGEVENKVTWDTACVAEDFWFAYQAAALGYKFGWLHAIVREQPPCTISDFFKQRRRWYTGILSIESVIVKFMLVSSLVGVACFFFYPIFGMFGYRVKLPPWYFSWVLWNDTTHIHAALFSSIIQDMTMTDISWVDVAVHAGKTVVLSPVIHFMQTAALVSSVFSPSRGFNVINKI
ncbi:glycosyl transferase family group 2-domain-containing protein [Aspergillus karnatakaensis]|uniref:glycosyltransferase family 2 protein n=1 Tax=Aspergillus karnatakaensis TaxID=1810916 RepID=UPI003CCD9C48